MREGSKKQKVDQIKEKHSKNVTKTRKSRLEIALRSIMVMLSYINEKVEKKYIDLEKQKLQADSLLNKTNGFGKNKTRS